LKSSYPRFAGVENLGQIENLVVFYDTGVLMRTLSRSGGLLCVATVEMTKYLQDISVGKVSHFSGNEEEALGILQTIIERKQAGEEVFRETAEAMANGEIDIPRLKAIEGMLTQPLNPSICSVMNFGSESDRLRF
jgi:hypothetical protein